MCWPGLRRDCDESPPPRGGRAASVDSPPTSIDPAANFDNMFTLEVDRFVAPLATLSVERMNQVCAAYGFAAGC